MNVIVAAVSLNGVIGKNNKLPWNVPSDLKHFRQLTLGKTLLMGRKTFEFLPKVLDQREIFVLSRQKDLHCDGAVVINHIAEIFKTKRGGPFFVVGGQQIYRVMMPYCSKLIITRVLDNLDGDTFFPRISEKEWMLTELSPIIHEPKDSHMTSVEVYERRPRWISTK